MKEKRGEMAKVTKEEVLEHRKDEDNIQRTKLNQIRHILKAIAFLIMPLKDI